MLHVRTVALTLLVALIAVTPSCRRRGATGPVGPAGPGGILDATVLPAPTDLRVTAHPGGPPSYVLRWTMPAPNTAIGMFAVYAANDAPSIADPRSIVAAVGGTARQAEIELASDTGMRHLRVVAINESGIAGLPSAEFVVDTTARMIFQASAQLLALRPADPTPTLLNNPPAFARGGQIAPSVPYEPSPDGRRVAWIDGGRLFARALDGSDPAPIDVTGTLVEGGIVWPAFGWSPDGKKLAFAASKLDVTKVEVFVATLGSAEEPVKVSGTMVGGGLPIAIALARTPSAVSPLVWSPDNRRIAYIASQRDADLYEVMVTSATGTSAPVPAIGDALPAQSGPFARFAWSPDGARLAFAADTHNAYDLMVTDGTGSVPIVAVTGQSPDLGAMWRFEWSPDGSRILFLDDPRTPGHVEPWIADPNGVGRPTPLYPTAVPLADTLQWQWSPDGTEVAFLAGLTNAAVPELFVCPATGGVEPVRISGPLVTGGVVTRFGWSRDGRQIAFLANKEQRFVQSLYVTEPDLVGDPVRLSNQFDQIREFAWSTSGDRLGFVFDNNDNTPVLYAASRRGGAAPNDLLVLDGLASLRWARLGNE